jgi:hypothetical protein
LLFLTTDIPIRAINNAPAKIEGRIIYYKQSDANFYQTFAYTWGRFLALTPQVSRQHRRVSGAYLSINR